MSEVPKVLRYADITVGFADAFETTVTEETIDAFAKLSGDTNPLHMDQTYAMQTKFGRRIPHGMIAGALFSRLIGMYLPGKYGVYLSQSLQFHLPIPMGESLVVRGEVLRKSDATRTLGIKTMLSTATTQVVVSGEALVQCLSEL